MLVDLLFSLVCILCRCLEHFLQLETACGSKTNLEMFDQPFNFNRLLERPKLNQNLNLPTDQVLFSINLKLARAFSGFWGFGAERSITSAA